MTPDEYIEMITGLLGPPAFRRDDDRTKRIQGYCGVLMGAGASLIRCYEILRTLDDEGKILAEKWDPQWASPGRLSVPLTRGAFVYS